MMNQTPIPPLEDAIRLYTAVLTRYCSGVLCDYHEAQDAVQETFINFE